MVICNYELLLFKKRNQLTISSVHDVINVKKFVMILVGGNTSLIIVTTFSDIKHLTMNSANNVSELLAYGTIQVFKRHTACICMSVVLRTFSKFVNANACVFVLI